MPNNKPYDKGGIVYYQRKGLKKSVILHLSPETHKKIKYMAWLKETSVQKLLAKTIEALVKDINFKGKAGPV
ncbi:MAG: hypothetical protein IPH91_03760 [Elusimicrobia bacterium]|jgi:hypothetical protein|nr:hypothetical protein [Elusimicrobiota bacterium]MBK8651428.1 hypothetical protein [Elusimicrobiota bacterium]MBL0350468.1 hypothetical protein [Elusimicrobiota bacterium]